MMVVAILMALWAGAAPAQDVAMPRSGAVAFYGMVFIDTSTEGAYNGVRADETARVALVEDQVRDRFMEEGFTLLSLDPIRERLDHYASPAHCNGCEVRLAAELGADYALVGEIQKVSNLILSMNLVMRDAQTGEAVRAQAVDFRSNTDDTWRRAMRNILKYHYFEDVK